MSIPPDEHQRLHAEAIVEDMPGHRTKGQLDIESYHFGPEDVASTHSRLPAKRKPELALTLRPPRRLGTVGLTEKHLGRQSKALT
jgi:hypothetical protein